MKKQKMNGQSGDKLKHNRDVESPCNITCAEAEERLYV